MPDFSTKRIATVAAIVLPPLISIIARLRIPLEITGWLA